MERMTACRLWVEALSFWARAQTDALESLEKALAQEADYLRRHDQARCLDALQARVEKEVEDIRRMEIAESLIFHKTTFISGVIIGALGSLGAALLGAQEHPLSVGAELAARDFARTKPFKTVMVAVGPGGVPDEVIVFSLSRCTRERNRTESGIAAAIESRGYSLMTPEHFSRFLEKIKEQVLEGNLTLPVANARPSLKLSGRALNGSSHESYKLREAR